MRAAFAEAHRARYGFDRDLPLEVVDVRVCVRGALPPEPPLDDDPWDLGERVADGPVRLDCPTTSVVVPEGWRARHDRGLLRLERVAGALLSARSPGAVRRRAGVVGVRAIRSHRVVRSRTSGS